MWFAQWADVWKFGKSHLKYLKDNSNNQTVYQYNNLKILKSGNIW